MSLLKHIAKVLQTILLLTAAVFSVLATGEVDPAFNPALLHFDYTSTSESIERTTVRRVVVQADGKILVAGNFSAVNKSVRDGIARFNADGTLDTTFNPPALIRPDGMTFLNVFALALQADGKILLGGSFTTAGTVIRRGIARLNTDGSLDSSFNVNTAGQSSGGTIRDIEVSADGKITIGGDYSVGNRQDVARVFPDGTVDASFNPQIPASPDTTGAYDIFAQTDGKVLVSLRYSTGDGVMYRLNADGSIDFSHAISGVSDIVHRMVVQPDGKILLGGSFEFIDGFTVPEGIVRLNANGTIDTTFNISNSGANYDVIDVELLANGKILIGGAFQSYNGINRQNLAVLNSDGSLDNSFNYTGRPLFVNDLAVQADGKIVVGTSANSDEFQGTLYPPLARVNADATLDTSIQPFIAGGGRSTKVFVQPDGKILVGGFFNYADTARHRSLTRFNADGTSDLSFTPSGEGFSDTSQIYEIDLQPDGKIILTGTISNGLRINQNGTFNRTFSNTPNPLNIKYLPTDKILSATVDIRRFSSEGFYEIQTGTVGNTGNLIYRVAVQADRKIIIVGSFTQINNSINRNRIARLNADCTFDDTFNSPGTNGTINNIALQPDGKMIISGLFTSVSNNSNYKYLARLNADGTLDTSFNPVLNAQVTSLKLQPDGRILVGGAFSLVNGISRNSLVRLNQNGTLDTTFNLGSGTDGLIRSIDLQTDSKIIIGGDFRRVNGVERFGIARLFNTAVPTSKLFDYDGDGRADVSVFRATENRWYVFRSSDSVVAQQVFAIAGDVPVPADYDGDLKTDYAIYRPSNGAWWYLSSINNAQITAQWGGEGGDIPRPSDFDGDGKSDFIIFRPTNNIWYRISSAGGAVSNVQFGLAGDKPVTGDFDGDGKSDVAIYHPSNGDWWWQSSVDNIQRATHWGISTDIPASADYDGDGKTDFAVYRPSTGVWYIYNSGNNLSTILNFGLSEDKPVPADYDGDGKADIGVFRPSSGVWYQMRSTSGFAAMQFGVSSDVPIPNSFIP